MNLCDKRYILGHGDERIRLRNSQLKKYLVLQVQPKRRTKKTLVTMQMITRKDLSELLNVI